MDTPESDSTEVPMDTLEEKEKKTRNSLSIKDKLQIIREIRNGESQTAVAKRRGLPRQSVNLIWKLRSVLEAKAAKCHNDNQKRVRKLRYEKIDEAVIQWFHSTRSLNVPILGSMLQEKALEFAQLFQIQGFKASEGWLSKFKSRYQICNRVIAGEAGAVDLDIVKNWFVENWPRIQEHYDPEDIFNCDETGLFWRLMHDRTLAVKNEKCTGGKLSKERITVLLCCNMPGTEKLTPLVIGKSAKPRPFEAEKRRQLASNLSKQL